MYVYICICMYFSMKVYICVCVCVYTHVFIYECMYVCMFVLVCVSGKRVSILDTSARALFCPMIYHPIGLLRHVCGSTTLYSYVFPPTRQNKPQPFRYQLPGHVGIEKTNKTKTNKQTNKQSRQNNQ